MKKILVLLMAAVLVLGAAASTAAASETNTHYASIVTPLKQYKNTASSLHYYTTGGVSLPGYAYEKDCCFVDSRPYPGTVALYACYNSGWFYTMDVGALNNAVNNLGYVNHGIYGYVVPAASNSPGTVHVYRWYKAGTTANPAADYLYTTGSEDYTGQGYAFQGVAFDAFKYPDPSYVTITTAPNGGETLTGGSTATVTWNANTTMDKVNLYYSLDSGSTWSFIATAPNTGNTGSYSWKVPFVSSTHCRVMVQYVLLDDKSQKVDACYGYSNSDFKITSTGIVIKPTIMLNISVLPAPCLLHADSDGKAVYLGWTNWSLTDTGYKVERTTGAAATSVQWETIATLPSHSSFYSDTAVTAGTTYIYRVKATGGLFDSAYSNEATIKPVVLPTQTASGTTLIFTLDTPTYTVNGIPVTMDVAPVAVNGRVMLPVRFICDPIGAEAVWYQPDQSVTITKAGTTLKLYLGSNTAYLNGAPLRIDPDNPDVTPVAVPPGRVMMPFRFICEKLGGTVSWNQDLHQATAVFAG